MANFYGNIEYTCNKCGYSEEVSIKDFDAQAVSGSERQMGAENEYSLEHSITCPNCESNIELGFSVWEYPVGALNLIEPNSKGAKTKGDPECEFFEPEDSEPF